MMTLKAFKRIRSRRKIILILLLSAFILGFLFLANRQGYKSGEWEGKGTLNLFPLDAKSKNYRVNAYMRIKMEPRGFYSSKKTYYIDHVTWPNGGKTYFEDCQVIPLENKNVCMDNDFRDWKIEIKNDPEIS